MNSFPIFFSILEVWLSPIRMTPIKNLLVKRVCVHLPLGFTMMSNHTYLKMRVSTECLLHVCHLEIAVPNSVLSMDFFFFSGLLLSRTQSMKDCCYCCRCRRCCFRGSGIFPLCGCNGFPMHAGRFDLRFNVVRILWTLLVIFHGGIGRFEIHIIEVLFLLAQFWTVISHPRIIKIRSCNFYGHTGQNCSPQNPQWSKRSERYGLPLNSVTKFSSVRDLLTIKKSSLMYKFFRHKLFLTWGNNNVLSNTSRKCTCTFELVDVHQCNTVDFPCGSFVCLLKTSFHSFFTAAFASGINIAWGERPFAHTLDFPRQASLRDRSPELSEPFVTLGFSISIFY